MAVPDFSSFCPSTSTLPARMRACARSREETSPRSTNNLSRRILSVLLATYIPSRELRLMKKQYRAVLVPSCVLLLIACCASFAAAEGKTRTYSIAVDEIDWDYTPMGMDKMMGMPFDKNSKMYFESDKHQIGRVYRKAVYREYTDDTFSTLKKRTPEWEHLGLLGPALHAEVGDTIQIFFKNK